MFNANTGAIMKRRKKTLAERKRQNKNTTADKPANPSFRNFTVRRTIEMRIKDLQCTTEEVVDKMERLLTMSEPDSDYLHLSFF